MGESTGNAGTAHRLFRPTTSCADVIRRFIFNPAILHCGSFGFSLTTERPHSQEIRCVRFAELKSDTPNFLAEVTPISKPNEPLDEPGGIHCLRVRCILAGRMCNANRCTNSGPLNFSLLIRLCL